jgi:hypothetical protein
MSSAHIPAPRTLDAAMDPAWLTQALGPLTGGASIASVDIVEVLRTMATKVRFVAHWRGGRAALCLKAFLDVDEATARGGAVTITEADFYTKIAPGLDLRGPACVAAVVEREQAQGVVIMRDLVSEGARFCTALEPFDANKAAASLEQLARLHARADVIAAQPWIRRRIGDFAKAPHVSQAALQDLLDGPRGAGLDSTTRDASKLLKGLSAIAERDAGLPQTLVHGDCHAGNIFQSSVGPGLIDWQLLQRGGWALDVAYHIAAVLPVDLAAREEWNLLRHYLDAARRFGATPPDFETAQAQCRMAPVYGLYLWSITRRVEPAIINAFVDRLGKAVMRYESYRLLGAS